MADDDDKPRRRWGRKRTLAVKTLTKRRLSDGWQAVGGELGDEFASERPRTRGDCRFGGVNEERPCPWVSCKHHLYLDVDPETGSIILNFPDLEPWELQHTCSIDVAERGGLTLEEAGEVMNLTRERIRQIEIRATTYKLAATMRARGITGR